MKILITDPISEDGINILKKHAQIDTRFGLKHDELKSVIGGYDTLIVRSQTKVTADIIQVGKNLKIIARAGAGVDNVDITAATNEGIQVINAPTSNTIAVAELVFGLMIALARHIPIAHGKLKTGVWAKKESLGFELKGKTLGIIGLGRIGGEVAKRAQAFGMTVLASDPFVSDDYARSMNVRLVPLETLLGKADFITLHLLLNESTRGIIGTKELVMAKPTMYVINTARGELIDESALAKALVENRIGGAAVDVYCEEPATASTCPLLAFDNVIHTPHIAASTVEAQNIGATIVAEQIVDMFNGKAPKHSVNNPAPKR